MKRENILNSLIDLDYFSSSYLTDDILLTMISHDTNYFRLQETKSRDGADHYFYFKIWIPNDNPKARVFEYDCVDKHIEAQ